jgi:hypothetical protein
MPSLFQHPSFVPGRSGGIASTTPGNRGVYSANLGATVTGHSVIAAFNAKSDTAGSVIASPWGGGAQGVVCRAPGTNEVSHVVVNTFNASGALADHAFYLAVV